MSGRLVSTVFDSALPAWLKPYAAVCATFAADDGTRVYPSIAKIARMVGRCERSTQRAVHELRARGVLTLEAGPGHHRAPRYLFHVDALPQVGDPEPDQLPLFPRPRPAKISTVSTGTNTTPVSVMGDTSVTRSVSDPSSSTNQTRAREQRSGSYQKTGTDR